MKRPIRTADGDLACPHCGTINQLASGILRKSKLTCKGCGKHLSAKPGAQARMQVANAKAGSKRAAEVAAGMGRCHAHRHLVAYSEGTCPHDGSVID